MVAVCIPSTVVLAADPNWFDTDWDYRKSFTVDESDDGAMTDYQMAITVNRGAGVDAGNTVYVNGKCEADYDDIRFTNDSGTLLDYWIESYDANTAKIWVELDSVAADDTYFWMYYGNAAAAAYSDGDDTWIFYDGFNGIAIDEDKWTVAISTGLSFSGTEMLMTNVAGAYPYIYSDDLWPKSLRHGARVKFSATNLANNHFLSLKNVATTHYSLNYSKATANNLTTSQCGGGAATTNYQPYTDVTAYHVYMQTWQTDEILLYQDTTLKYTRTLTIPTEDMYILCRGGSTVGGIMTMDWVYIGNWTDDDLVVDTWGSEEQPSAPKVTTEVATNITATTAIASGNVTATGHCTITERGVEYGTASGVYTDNASEVGAFGAGVYSFTLTSLTPGTQYFYRAWATNAMGTTYDEVGDEEDFTTLLPLPEPPTNVAGTIEFTDNVALTWTKGLYAENTTIVRHLGHFPTSMADGVIVYSGPLALFTDNLATIVDLSEHEVYYSLWSVNASGDSLTYTTFLIGGVAMAAALSSMANVFLFLGILIVGVALLGLSWWMRVGAFALIAAVFWFVFGCYGVATGLLGDAAFNAVLGVISIMFAFGAAFMPMLWRKPELPEEEDDYTSIGEERDAGGEPDEPIQDGYGKPYRARTRVPARQIRADRRRNAEHRARRRLIEEP